MWAAGTERGFTLLEMILVLVIATLVLSLAAPRLSKLMPGMALRADTQKVAALLRKIRADAVASGQPQALRWDPQLHALVPDQGQLLPLAAGVQFHPSGPKGPWRFYPDGSSSDFALELSADGNQYRIDVNWLTGKVSIHD
ncbi:GspH/FimT family pseudopilin [Gallaecimonas xiamenensis]|uniref:Type II secretion system protein H n=1 Tax=Gallaecimonas xiamenensis 3-C-1 TaxID=745411 RepID=K2KF24_9GAMM|nr:GspH/FimT family pseudopilin [Gallaecimonas xiamenensis]EKE75975.1 general secretion pathway protein H [Gallaecimonas xiamenensis 3-C-1]